MKAFIYAITNKGLLRTNNQDNFICDDVSASVNARDFRYAKSCDTQQPFLLAVFDGMGGHLYGERASEIAVTSAKSVFEECKENKPKEILNRICNTANDEICEEMNNVVKGRMGSTASMVLLDYNQFHLCNLGDSKVHLIRNNQINTISYEHTERKNYEEIFGKNYDKNKKFKLTQHLGIFPHEMELSPYHYSDRLLPDDILLLSSDGLTDMVSEDEILQIISGQGNIKRAAETLLETALNNGGKDNITIIICKIDTSNELKSTPIVEGTYHKANNQKKQLILNIIVGTLIAILFIALIVLFLKNYLKDKTIDADESNITQETSYSLEATPDEISTSFSDESESFHLNNNE